MGAGAANDSESVTEITDRLSAAIEFTMFVAREFLINNYSVEKHESDVYNRSNSTTSRSTDSLW